MFEFFKYFQCESKRALMAISAGPWDFFRSDFYLFNLKSFQSQKPRKTWPMFEMKKMKKSIWSNFDARCLIFDLLQNPSSRQTYDRPMPIKCFHFWHRLSAFSEKFVELGDIFPNSWKIANATSAVLRQLSTNVNEASFSKIQKQKACCCRRMIDQLLIMQL